MSGCTGLEPVSEWEFCLHAKSFPIVRGRRVGTHLLCRFLNHATFQNDIALMRGLLFTPGVHTSLLWTVFAHLVPIWIDYMLFMVAKFPYEISRPA